MPSPGRRPGRLGWLTRVPLEKGAAWRLLCRVNCSTSALSSWLLGSQLGHLLLQHRNLALQLSHQGQQFLSAQRCYVFRATHTVKCSQLAPGPQSYQPERYSITGTVGAGYSISHQAQENFVKPADAPGGPGIIAQVGHRGVD